MSLKILYEDEHFLAVEKPAGRLVIPGGTAGEVSIAQELSEVLGQKLFVVHRIDRDASGIVLFAKNAQAHRAACLEFEHRRAHKKYWAVVLGHLEGEGEIDQPLREFGSGRMAVDKRGKPAKTRYRAVETFESATLVEVEPLTGRRHQVRAHFYWLGHPVLGDRLYGHDRPVGNVARLMLHGHFLELEPQGYERLSLSSDLPEDFRDILERLRSKKQEKTKDTKRASR